MSYRGHPPAAVAVAGVVDPPPPSAVAAADSGGGLGPWPEDDPTDGLCCRCNSMFGRWSFSYMDRILDRGAEINRDARRRRKMGGEASVVAEDEDEDEDEDAGGDDDDDDDGGDDLPRRPLQLTQDDMYRAPSSMRVSVLRPKFNRYYSSPPPSTTTSTEGRLPRRLRRLLRRRDRPLVRALWQLARPTFVPAGFCQLCTVIAQVSVPIFVWRLLLILENDDSHPGGRSNVFREAVPYVFLTLAADVINAYCTHRQRFLSMSSGVAIRVAVLGAIYERTLKLTPRGAEGLTTGNVSTLFATDTQKLYEVAAEGHLLWSAPLSMLLVAIALVVVVGPSMAVGIALLLLFVPVVQGISVRMMNMRKLRVRATDRRVEIVNAMLLGIKVTKLNNYEDKYSERIDRVRDEELGLLRREFHVWSLLMAVQFISPVVASAGAFASYVLVGNILTTSDAFTALLLFNALRFPINYASRLAGKIAQAGESARRLSVFMKRETRGWDDDARGGGGDASRIEEMKEDSISSTENTNDSFASVDGESDAIECGGGLIDGFSNGNNTHAVSGRDMDDLENEIRDDDPSPFIGNDGILSLPPPSRSNTNNAALIIKDGVFYTGDALSDQSWETINTGDCDSGFAVGGVNMSVRPGEILAIVGPVGSGKSTIINGIIGEIPVSPMTSLTMHGRVAYSSQVAFILNATLRDNILFGNKFVPERYNQVLDACCLRADLEQLPAGDQTEIGERGVTLSGGQKQRISLARVVYSNPDIALFDDPLSALDAGTSRFVFDRLFKQCKGNKLLSKTAVILVTHSSHFLNQVNQVMVVVDGKVPFCGTWLELTEARLDNHDPKAKIAIESILDAVQENSEHDNDYGPEISGDFNHSCLIYPKLTALEERTLNAEQVNEALMSLETREHGQSRLRAWAYWFRYAGGTIFTVGVFTLFILEKVFYFFTEWWISVWTKATEFPTEVLGVFFYPQSAGIAAQLRYIQIYCILMTLAFICAFSRTVWIAAGAIRCSKKLYSVMTYRVLHSPMVYFETTPMGRLLNRFTYDAEILDVTLVWSMSMLLISSSWFVAAVVVMVAILPWIFFFLVPITILYVMIHRHYRKSGADLQRLDALSRSPLQTMLIEATEGSATIRTFRKEQTFIKRFQDFADKSTAAQMNFIVAQRWLGVRIELLGAAIVFCTSLLVVIFWDFAFFNLDAGMVALLIRWSSGLTISLSFLCDNAAEAEGAITAIERIQQMSEIAQELNFSKVPNFDESWPARGELEFRDVKMRYRPQLPLSLDGLSFRVEAGEHCGVVGRTGAGKSSLLTALFRLVEIEGGSVVIDGVDLSKIGLSDIRGRPNGISIIPQDPFLFAGTMRECLDPFGSSTDDKLLDALASVRMLPRERTATVLDSRIEEGGANYSVGQRSLLVLARAMLARPKVLLMDEATANIDGETDKFIQRMLRTRFSDTTLLTIAHRLETIMDYEKVLVLSDGKAAEFGTPIELIENNGIFTDLVNATGEGAASLISIANEAAENRRRKNFGLERVVE